MIQIKSNNVTGISQTFHLCWIHKRGGIYTVRRVVEMGEVRQVRCFLWITFQYGVSNNPMVEYNPTKLEIRINYHRRRFQASITMEDIQGNYNPNIKFTVWSKK